MKRRVVHVINEIGYTTANAVYGEKEKGYHGGGAKDICKDKNSDGWHTYYSVTLPLV